MNGKSIGSVAAGEFFIIAVTTIVDVCLHAAGIYRPAPPPMTDALAALATSYRLAISVAGAWLTARLAPVNPMKHAMILGYVGTALGLLGVVLTWNKGLGPSWYPIVLAALAIPQCWAGGKLYEMTSGRR